MDKASVLRPLQITFNIVKPDVFKAPGADTYVIFGEAKIEDTTTSQAAAAPFRQAPDLSKFAAASAAASAARTTAPAAAAEEEGDADETGLEAKDIELVCSQTGVSRAKAVKALKANDGDIVNAIMELTS